MHKNKIFYGLAGVCVLLAGLFYMIWRSGRTEGAVNVETGVFADKSYAAANAQSVPDGGEESSARICVYVCGAVAQPGIYYLEEGARVAQALEAAGGMLSDADISALNPAMRAADSQKIYVPTVSESAGQASCGDADGGIIGGLVNINTADAALLSTLPGIGAVKAESIVAYRETNGAFLTVEDIKNVSGIKDSSYDKIKDLICI